MTELTKLASWTTLERKKATEIDYRLDKDGDKEVDRDEFIVWWEWVVRNPQIVPLRKKATIEAILNDDRDALLQVFNTFDVDRGETLDRNEATEVVSCEFTSTPAVACCDFNPSLSERLLVFTALAPNTPTLFLGRALIGFTQAPIIVYTRGLDSGNKSAG